MERGCKGYLESSRVGLELLVRFCDRLKEVNGEDLVNVTVVNLFAGMKYFLGRNKTIHYLSGVVQILISSCISHQHETFSDHFYGDTRRFTISPVRYKYS